MGDAHARCKLRTREPVALAHTLGVRRFGGLPGAVGPLSHAWIWRMAGRRSFTPAMVAALEVPGFRGPGAIWVMRDREDGFGRLPVIRAAVGRLGSSAMEPARSRFTTQGSIDCAYPLGRLLLQRRHTGASTDPALPKLRQNHATGSTPEPCTSAAPHARLPGEPQVSGPKRTPLRRDPRLALARPGTTARP